MCDVVSKTLLKKPIVFQKNALFSNMCTFLSHCFETKNYHCLTELQNANKFSYILFPNHLFFNLTTGGYVILFLCVSE